MSTKDKVANPRSGADTSFALELKSLIDMLLKLRLEISSRLLDSRLQLPKSSAGARNSADISDLLKGQIDDFVTESKIVDQTPKNQAPKAARPNPAAKHKREDADQHP
jgi:hypothetical protein